MTPHWPGRWSLVHRIGVWGREVPFEERIARQARQLLQCYGIVTRQSLEGDPEGGWDWRALYPQFQLMEMRGEVRRGYFVQGLPGVQFALPEAVERLRDWTHPDAGGSGLPAGETVGDYVRCVSCHGWDRLGENGGFVRRTRTAERGSALMTVRSRERAESSGRTTK